MKYDAEKIAALAMIRLNERERARLDADIPVILAMSEALPPAAAEAETFAHARTADDLRADEVSQPIPPERVRALSENEKDGYLHVVRTVG